MRQTTLVFVAILLTGLTKALAPISSIAILHGESHLIYRGAEAKSHSKPFGFDSFYLSLSLSCFLFVCFFIRKKGLKNFLECACSFYCC